MTKTGKVGTFGGMQIPAVTTFMKGYQAGVKYYNQVHGTAVAVLGWDDATQEGLFTGNFNSTDDGRSFAISLVRKARTSFSLSLDRRAWVRPPTAWKAASA